MYFKFSSINHNSEGRGQNNFYKKTQLQPQETSENTQAMRNKRGYPRSIQVIFLFHFLHFQSIKFWRVQLESHQDTEEENLPSFQIPKDMMSHWLYPEYGQ